MSAKIGNWVLLVVLGFMAGFCCLKGCGYQKELQSNSEQILTLQDSITNYHINADTTYDTAWKTITIVKRIPQPYIVKVTDTVKVYADKFDLSDTLHFDDLNLSYRMQGSGVVDDFGIDYQILRPDEITLPCPPAKPCRTLKERKTFVFAAVGYKNAGMIGIGTKVIGGFSVFGATHVSMYEPMRASALIGVQYSF